MSNLDPHKKNSMLLTLQKAWEIVNELSTTTPCMACHFHAHGVCRMADNQKIPADVLPTGCPEWKFDPESIPF